MIYRDFQGLKLSALGFGAMRLPVIGGDDGRIEENAALEMVDIAMKNGINYYDTAWGYHDGNSELVLGRALARYPRDSYYVATKFPGYDPSNWNRVEEIFEQQLKKLGTDHFDFYLFHNVCEMNIDAYLDDEKYGIYSYLMKQKKNGRIRHLGFSCHGRYEVLKRFLEAYGEDVEFCQLQVNFLDWKLQKAKEKVDLLREYGIPLWVMEPLRGGKLIPFEVEYEEKLRALRPEETDVGWCFRFLQTIPEATVILSGMSDLQQLKENIATFETDAPLDENEWAVLTGIADDMLSKKTLPCTGCRYCTDYCPMELDIPLLISLYNEQTVSGGGLIAPMVLRSLPEEKSPAACLGCPSCEQVCPQGIKISEAMSDFGSRVKKKQ